MTDDLVVNDRLRLPSGELRERFSRSSGPGGQGVNTTDSRVELRFDLAGSPSLPPWLRQRLTDRLAERLVDGVLVVVASEHREQLRNRRAARARMAELLRTAAAPPAPPRRRTKPSRASVQRRLETKRKRGQVKRNRRRGDPGE